MRSSRQLQVKHKVSIYMSRWRIIAVACLVVVLSACNDSTTQGQKDQRLSEQDLAARQKEHSDDANVYHFGFELRASPQEDARQYLPFLKYLEGATGYRFELEFTPENEDIVNNLGTGEVHFAAIGAVSFIEAQNRLGVLALAHGINPLGKSEYRAYIVVQPNSSIESIADLRGKHFAFGSTTSTQGHLIPRIMLHQQGLSLDDLAGYTYTGSHQNCADALVAQRADACGMQDTLAERLAKQGTIRILHRSDYYPSSGIAANHDVPDEVIARVREALGSFDPKGQDAKGLYKWERTEMPNGFSPAESQDYRNLKHWMQKLGLLEEAKP